MDLAKNLLRSITRSFYSAEHVLILDALVLHSTLRDDDLAYLMGQQTKHLRKLCGKLREDGLLSVHSRLEQREGAQRPFSRDYYWIDYHRSIDVVKFRLKSMTTQVEKKYGATVEEKKEYFCPQCHSEYTQMEVLDSTDPLTMEFICKKCSHLLRQLSEEELNGANQGHEVQSRLNKQLSKFEALLQQIDGMTVPESDFEKALANRLEVQRNDVLNPAAKTEVVNGGRPGFPVATVKGMKVEADKIEVKLVEDAEASKEELAAKQEAKAKIAAQNTLPVWHTESTVNGMPTSLGQASTQSFEAPSLKPEESDEKKPDLLADSSNLDAFFASLRSEEQERERAAQSSDQSESDDFDEEDEDDFEDVGFDASSGRRNSGEKRGRDEDDEDNRRPPAAKRVKLEMEAAANASSPVSEEKSTPLAGHSDGEGEARVNGGAKREDEESEEEPDFEDAL